MATEAFQRTPDTSEWVVNGQPLRDLELRQRILDDVGAVDSLLPPPEATSPDRARSFDGADLLIEATIDRASDALVAEPDPSRASGLFGLVRTLVDLQRELAEERVAHRSRVFARVQDSLARLHDVTSVDQIMELIPAEVLRIGFSRVILSRVHDSRWMPEVCIVEGDPEWGAEIVRVGREQEQLLDHMILETEMVRRRVAMIVQDVQNDPRAHRPIADASFSRSYVAAPIMPEGRVIGFIHADCYVERRHVDEFDRDVLGMFAEGAGYAFERTVLLERLHDLRGRVHAATESIAAMVDEVVDAELQVARLDRETAQVTRAAVSLVAPESRVYSLLTRREVEIAQLMAEGLTNSEIGRRLVITEGTVKTHISHILRKLRASNRAEATSKFMLLSR